MSEASNNDAIAHLEEREVQIYEMRVKRQMTLQSIATELQISPQRVSVILARIREKMPPPSLEEVRQQAIEMHLDIIERARFLAAMNGAPVTAGKDGEVVYDPENGTVVRDYSGRVRAHELELKSMKELRSLLGLDAAGKMEVAQTVRYVVEGVNTEDLK